MQIGLMRSRIKIQKSTITTDNIGNRSIGWTDYYTCSAYANQTGGNEREIAGQTVDSATITFTVRYCAFTKVINTLEYRVIFDGEIYNITEIDDFQFRHETLKLTAERVKR